MTGAPRLARAAQTYIYRVGSNKRGWKLTPNGGLSSLPYQAEDGLGG